MDDFIGRTDLIAPDRLRQLTRRSDWKGAVRTPSHFGVTGVTGVTAERSWLTWGSWWAAPWFVLRGMLPSYLCAARHECNRYTAP